MSAGAPAEAHPEGFPHTGRYVREMPVNLERMFENALDWEHLPALHRSTFQWIELLESRDDGLRARVGYQPDGAPSIFELTLDRELRRWITRNVEGGVPGSEIWTVATPLDEKRIRVDVDFYVPGVPAEKLAAVGAGFAKIYQRLYDEDEAMMIERQRALDARAGGGDPACGPVSLGRESELRARLPHSFTLAGERFRVVDVDGELVAHALTCPHWLGPLDVPVEQGSVRCPWHDYRFDLRSGEETAGRRCRLRRAELNLEADGRVVARA